MGSSRTLANHLGALKIDFYIFLFAVIIIIQKEHAFLCFSLKNTYKLVCVYMMFSYHLVLFPRCKNHIYSL